VLAGPCGPPGAPPLPGSSHQGLQRLRVVFGHPTENHCVSPALSAERPRSNIEPGLGLAGTCSWEPGYCRCVEAWAREMQQRGEEFAASRRSSGLRHTNRANRVIHGWHSRCIEACNVSILRTNLSAIALLVALLLTRGAPLFAAEASHKACMATHPPDCHRPTGIAQCCGNDSDISNQPVVTRARVEVAADRQSVISVLPCLIETARTGAITRHVDTSPTRGPSAGLTILFADLRL